MRAKEFLKEGLFDSKPKVDWNKRAKELFAKGLNEQQVIQQLVKEGCPPNQAPVYVQGGQLEESATAGATSTANIGTVVNPHISPGKARGKKSYTGKPGKSGKKSPAQPKIVQRKNKNGTAKGAHELKGVSLFGGPAIKR